MKQLKYKHKDRLCLVLKRTKNYLILRDEISQFKLDKQYIDENSFIR